ncbi:hypothetical protein [Streptomyces sp. WM6372]|uniref:hypothetical protein n=1 Tax=Streptomyces sp. WM6372 TaxID=1415555 RepID=UPI00131C09EA|nr:hypothetical protein [Streptomyces sp. WM6372]
MEPHRPRPVPDLTTDDRDPDPDPGPPTPAIRRLLTECPDLVTDPLIYDVEDRDPAALARLLAADQALRDQSEDRHRAGALAALIANLVDTYGTGDGRPV